jgi:hypothetical protein
VSQIAQAGVPWLARMKPGPAWEQGDLASVSLACGHTARVPVEEAHIALHWCVQCKRLTPPSPVSRTGEGD